MCSFTLLPVTFSVWPLRPCYYALFFEPPVQVLQFTANPITHWLWVSGYVFTVLHFLRSRLLNQSDEICNQNHFRMHNRNVFTYSQKNTDVLHLFMMYLTARLWYKPPERSRHQWEQIWLWLSQTQSALGLQSSLQMHIKVTQALILPVFFCLFLQIFLNCVCECVKLKNIVFRQI